MRLLNKIYGLVHAGRCLFNILCNDRSAIWFEQSEADLCVFRKLNNVEEKMLVVVHVDDILAHAKYEATMARFAAELGGKFKVKVDGGDVWRREAEHQLPRG